MKYYTALCRKKGDRRYYLCGYRSNDLETLRDVIYADIREGKYASAKIVEWDTGKLIEKVM